MNLRRFQSRFIQSATAPGIQTAALSLPRGNGKSWLAAHMVARALSPTDPLFVPGSESVLAASSIEQARIVFKFCREALEPSGRYRFLDSVSRIAVTHTPSNTRLRVISSKAKSALGLVGVPLCVADEPGGWEQIGGEAMSDALVTAQGKPGSPMKIVFIGTLAPARSGWWKDLVERGSHGSVHVTKLQGNPNRWDQWPEIRRCNPLTAISPEFRKKLIEERDEARADPRLRARFLSFRLNVPSADERRMLLDVSDWNAVLARPVPGRDGQPVVGIDLGGGRAWSAACAVWRNGRVEAVALAPGIPNIQDQEKRDRVPRGTYERLVGVGRLRLSPGLRVPRVADLTEAVLDLWGPPSVVFCDRFRLPELADTGLHPLMPRVGRWSESSEDIRGLRRLALDGPLAVEPESRDLLTVSMGASLVESDDSGNSRMIKASSNNQGRDDVAAALVLAAGAVDRERRRPAPVVEVWEV